MRHRHIDDTDYTLPAIDSIIERGCREDWAALQIAVRRDPAVRGRVLEVAANNLDHPYTDRYRFWFHYAKRSEHERQAV